jgi:antitoxin component YwqK of YwqJK toxin-antitoxin module
MKILSGSLVIIFALLLCHGCKGKSSPHRNSSAGNDSIAVTDTGFTGIKKYMSGNILSMETTFKNGVKDGLTKTFYASGKLRSTLWYENGLREDSAKWYFEEGQLFRSTPYKRDTIDGIQKQYFRNGKLKALIGYKKGLRTFEFDEFDMEGRKVGGYPDMIVNAKDDYNSKGIYRLSIGLSDKSTKVKYFRGDFGTGLFDSTRCVKIKTINGIGILDLKKTGTPQAVSVDVLAVIITFYGNNYLVHKKIELPYKDLN